MNHPNPILNILNTLPSFSNAVEQLRLGKGPVAAFGLQDTHKAHIAATLQQTNPVLYVCSTDSGAAAMFERVKETISGAALLLPREIPLVHVLNVSGSRSVERSRALTAMLYENRPLIITSAAALMQRLAPKTEYREMCIVLQTGQETAPRDLVDALCRNGYERVEMVEGRGQVAARGDLVDVYPPQMRYPVRIEFWGDSIDQMRDFDPVSQVSVEQRTEVLISPAFETPQPREKVEEALKKIDGKEGFEAQKLDWEVGVSSAGADVLLPFLFDKMDSVFDYLPEETLILADEPKRIEEAARIAESVFSEMVAGMLENGEGDACQGELQMPAREMTEQLERGKTLMFHMLQGGSAGIRAKGILQIATFPVTQYLGDSEELIRDLKRWKDIKEKTVLFSGANAVQLYESLEKEGIHATLSEHIERLPENGEILIVSDELSSGFSYPELHITALGLSELFGKKTTIKQHARKKNVLSFSELKKGDYVVHESHGIGRFTGVETLTVQGNTRDYIQIEYRGGDKLYIPTDQMDRVQKYIGGGDEDTVPVLSKLGGAEWQNRVSKARTAAKKLAIDLAALYAERISIKGIAFSKDSAWQIQMEERFPYNETPDQLRSIEEIKNDMESEHPMDRLLCGDVGYGKTEVAMRAAFKAVQDSRQVAVLVPTTVLAQQHFNTFSSRLADFPVRVGVISRFQTTAQRQEIKKKIQAGEVDIIIGTHALLAKDVIFKNLGLLIIDEEHRFGVNHKEKLKEMRKQVDVLTLTATPIPRTLNLSMTGIRDISIIDTPPEGRYPTQTVVMEYTDSLLVDAVTKEIGRGGQVYLVSNRVNEMEMLAGRVRKLIPDCTVLIAHGQMPEHQLEQAMMDFVEHKADILICSTIIESGLDLPNANTMIILDADRFGLAQLYQLRGRIGRGTRMGYAYLTVQRGKSINEKAQKRLKAIREFTQFGAGFQLAMRDLEIRGAGSFLGAEQHGHIADIGYEYYLKLIQTAVREAAGKEPENETDVQMEIPINAHIPQTYIASEVQRLSIYRRIAETEGEAAAIELKEEMEDRYGEIPEEVENLFKLASIKNCASKAGIASLAVKDGKIKIQFTEGIGFDGERLLQVLSECKGARLLASAAPGIEIVRPREPIPVLTDFLPQFLYKIEHCITME